MRAVGIHVIVSFLYILTLQCSTNPKNVSSKDKLTAFAGTEPLTYLVERIGGVRVDVKTFIPPGQDPYHFKPTSQLLSDLQKAKVLFKTGFPLENHHFTKAMIFNDSITLVNTGMGLPPCRLYCGNPNHNHTTTADPYIWLGIPQIEGMVKSIAKALTNIDPKHSKHYRYNLETFLRELDDVSSTITQSLAPFKGQRFIAINPTTGYFADSYGLIEIVIDYRSDKKHEPFKGNLHIPNIPKCNNNFAPNNLTNTIEMAIKENARMIVIQPGSDTTVAAAIAQAVDGKMVTIDPLVKDVLQNLNDIAGKIEQALHVR